MSLKPNLAYKNLLAITIVTVLCISIVATQETLAAGLKVNVKLYHSNNGLTKVCVTSVYQNLGCRPITLSGLPNPYTPAPFVFGENVVPVGGQFKACVTNLIDQYRCVTGTNTPAKLPVTVTLTVPLSSGGDGGINWEDLCVKYHGLIGVTEARCHILAHGTQITHFYQIIYQLLLQSTLK